MSPVRIPYGWFVLSFPRVSGDEPELPRRAFVIDMFSPRERG